MEGAGSAFRPQPARGSGDAPSDLDTAQGWSFVVCGAFQRLADLGRLRCGGAVVGFSRNDQPFDGIAVDECFPVGAERSVAIEDVNAQQVRSAKYRQSNRILR